MSIGILDSRYTPLRFETSLARWYTPLDPNGSGILPADNAALSIFADKSKNAANLTQATSANRPLFRTNINGRPMVLFDGSNDFFSGSIASGPQYSITFFAHSTAAATQAVIYNGDSSHNGYGFFYSSSKLIVHGGNAIKTDGTNAQTFEIITFAWNGSASMLRVNGVSQSLGNANVGFNVPAENLLIGSSTGSVEFFNGYLGDIIIRNSYSLEAVEADEKFISTNYNFAI